MLAFTKFRAPIWIKAEIQSIKATGFFLFTTEKKKIKFNFIITSTK